MWDWAREERILECGEDIFIGVLSQTTIRIADLPEIESAYEEECFCGSCISTDLKGTEAEIQLPLKRSSRFQRLVPNPSWLV